MAAGGSRPNQDKYHKNKPEVFEYEDFGTPSLYLWTAVVVAIMIAIVVVFGLIVAGGAVAISGAING